MPRPFKWRRVCCLPENNRYGPLNAAENDNGVVQMSVDEYEAIRLIDTEGYTQEKCAEHMNVSRSTIQSIYDSARKKLSDSLVYGKVLWIEGGEYRLCDGRSDGCGGGGCHRHRCGRNARIKSEPYDQATQTETEKTNEDRNTDE
ncbi:MAG: DUF134 domain-containing protein [Clostridiales bacterium]|nr:DUF134 domain-containing protein [Clostridiales bacterium]